MSNAVELLLLDFLTALKMQGWGPAVVCITCSRSREVLVSASPPACDGLSDLLSR